MFDDTLPPRWADLGRDAWAYGFQFARFFGPSGGQKLAEAVEIGNEPGKYDDASYRKLFENAAGGMRRGDPKLLIAMCAMYARPSGEYHKDLATVKGLEALYDVISVHSYPELEPYPTWRRSFPEDPRLDFLPNIREVIAWRDAQATGKQIWLTEFGWDATTRPRAKEGSSGSGSASPTSSRRNTWSGPSSPSPASDSIGPTSTGSTTTTGPASTPHPA